MPLYLGLPVTIKELHRIFGLDMEVISTVIIKKYKQLGEQIPDYYYMDEINEQLKECIVKIRLYSTDKGQIIIGYIIEEPSDVWNKFINADEFVRLLTALKTRFSDEMSILGANLDEVTLEYMEGNEENTKKVKNPVPYVISYL